MFQEESTNENTGICSYTIVFLSNLSNKCKPKDPRYTKLLTMYVDGINMGIAGGGGWGRRWFSHARHQSPRGSKLGSTVSILNKEIDFQNFTNFKLLS
jgi:hypothetical protein